MMTLLGVMPYGHYALISAKYLQVILRVNPDTPLPRQLTNKVINMLLPGVLAKTFQHQRHVIVFAQFRQMCRVFIVDEDCPKPARDEPGARPWTAYYVRKRQHAA